jgi:hypothetical protein
MAQKLFLRKSEAHAIVCSVRRIEPRDLRDVRRREKAEQNFLFESAVTH